MHLVSTDMNVVDVPRIALIHAVPVAMDPVSDAFRTSWPEAEPVHLLDDSLSRDRAAAGAITPAMIARFETLTRYATDIGAKGILFTCSAFGEAIGAARELARVPVLKPNEAMFEAALALGSRIGMLATFEPSIGSMTREFDEAARVVGSTAALKTVYVPQAMTALRSGDVATHNRLLAEAAPQLGACDALMLAQFSTSRARHAVAEVFRGPVLTSPGSAVSKLRTLLS